MHKIRVYPPTPLALAALAGAEEIHEVLVLHVHQLLEIDAAVGIPHTASPRFPSSSIRFMVFGIVFGRKISFERVKEALIGSCIQKTR